MPFNFDFINRAALVIKAKQPFINWLINIDSEDDLTDIRKESDIYLIPEYEELNKLEKWLMKNYDQIFCDQLNLTIL